MGRSVAAVVNEIGFGVSQLRTGVLVNGAWLADGAEALAISAVAVSLAKEFSIGDVETGTLTSVVYLGAMIGTLLSGFLGDFYGRRPLILASYPVIIAFSLVSTLPRTFQMLLVTRLFVGFGFGLGQPNAITLLVEITPSKWRVLNQGLLQVAFMVGELFCCMVLWIDDPTMENTSWRTVLMWSALPAGIFLCFSVLFLSESPAFLALSSPAAAKSSLQSMAEANGKEVSIDLDLAGSGWSSFDAQRPERSMKDQLLVVFSPNLLRTTLALCWVCFCYNLVVYGCFFAFPQVLPHMNVGMTPVAALAVGALWELPGDIVGVGCGMWLPRRYTLAIYLVGQVASAGIFLLGSINGTSALLLTGYYGLKSFPQVGSIALYTYAAELYPVEARATGTAMVLGVGRLGAILSSVIYGYLYQQHGNSHAFFRLSILLSITSMVAVCQLPETRPWAGQQSDEESAAIVLKD